MVSKTLIIIFTFKALLYASSYLAIISLSHGSLIGYGEAKVLLKSHSKSPHDSPFVSSTVSCMPIGSHSFEPSVWKKQCMGQLLNINMIYLLSPLSGNTTTERFKKG